MANSRAWIELKRQIEILRRQFLPASFDPLGRYDEEDRVQAHTRAFLVLSHAEVETFIEDWAKDIARKAETVWNSSQKTTEPLAIMMAHLGTALTISETYQKPAEDSRSRYSDACTKVIKSFYERIKKNNGVKEKNFLTLFAPLGVPAVATGLTLLPNLNTFGANRGDHAHHAARAVANPLDPETEYKFVKQVLNDLDVLDKWLVGYRRRIR